MQIVSQNRRWTSAQYAVVWGLDLAIAFVVTHFLQQGWFGFIVTLVAIQGMAFVLWVRRAIGGWAVYELGGKKKLSQFYQDGMARLRFPEPDDVEASVESYWARVAEDETAPMPVRFAANTWLVEMRSATHFSGILASVRMTLAAEDALQAYKKTFARSPVHAAA